MQDHLVAVAGGPAIQVSTQPALGEEAERVRTPLGWRHFIDEPVARQLTSSKCVTIQDAGKVAWSKTVAAPGRMSLFLIDA
jgi:hypothetical protein